MLRSSMVGLLAASALIAQSPLTTTFANNNAGAVGGAVYFDLGVTASAITITSIDLNLAGTGSVDIYTTPGTRVGQLTTPGAWTLVASGPVTGATAGTPAPIQLPPFTLANGTYGVAILTNGVSHAYTNGTGTNQNYANAEATLAAGEASNVPWTGILTPRVVNTSIRYLVGAGVPLPAHATVYNGASRGFNFTAAASFNIRELALPPQAFQAGDTASYLVRINGATAYRSIGNAGSVNPNLHVAIGDVVDVIGNWSPASAGSFTAHNSYGNTAPFATTIAGVAHTLNRTGWQWDIGDPSWVDTGGTGSVIATGAGQIGRVLMTTEPTNTGAASATLGQGCISRSGSFHELMTAAAFDLGNSAVTLLPIPGGGYNVTRLGNFLPVGSTSAPTILALGDDSQTTVPFTTGAFPGWTGVNICSNGFISKAVGNGTGFTPSVSAMLAAPQDAFWSWHDFNPNIAASGKVKIEQGAGITVVTWDGVWDFAGASAASANTLQFQLYASGIVTIAWGTMSGLGGAHLVGYSPGGPSPANAIDISAIGGGSIPLPGTEINPLTLTASNRPIVGTTWNLNVDFVPANGILGVDVLGLSDPGINDLAFLGMPTCGLRASLDVLDVWFVAGSTHSRSFPVPNFLPLLNVNVYATTAVFQNPPVNAFGAITSNGLRGTIGDQ